MHYLRLAVSYRWYGVVAAFFAVVLLTVGAMTAHGVAAQEPVISQGFATESTDLQSGSLVSSDPAGRNAVKLADSSLTNALVGVVADEAILEIDPSQQKIQVVTSGVTEAIVSDINGQVKKGDRLTASPVAGVGMKTRGGTQVVGVALTDMDLDKTIERTIQNREGKEQVIHVGHVDVLVNVAFYPVPEEQNSILPSFLLQFAAIVAGKEVSVARVIVALLIVLIGMSGAAILLNSSVRSSIISIGRNPLSERIVRKSLFGVLAMSLGIIGATIGVVYLVLKI